MEAVSQKNDIHLILKEMIERKSLRDKVTFTMLDLAQAIGMPHSTLVKLMHQDPAKRILNPRVGTLAKIVNFFKQDGFNVTIEDFLFKNPPAIDNQLIYPDFSEKIVSVYSFDPTETDPVGTMRVGLPNTFSDKVIALLSDEDIKPMFKKGSTFIIDMNMKPTDGTLVAVKIEGISKIIIRKLHIINHTKILKSFDQEIPPIKITSEMSCQIVGVIVQINAKT